MQCWLYLEIDLFSGYILMVSKIKRNILKHILLLCYNHKALLDLINQSYFTSYRVKQIIGLFTKLTAVIIVHRLD